MKRISKEAIEGIGSALGYATKRDNAHSPEIFNNILRQYGESVSRINRGEPMKEFVRDPIEFQDTPVTVSCPRTGLTGQGATEEEAMADLQAQVDEIREKHLLRHPFQHCGCIVCEPWNHGKIQS
jgi:hypothetical protein